MTPRVLYFGHGHPRYSKGGGEVFAYELFEEIALQAAYEPFFVGRISSDRPPHLTPFSAVAGIANEVLFHNPPERFDYFLQTQRLDRQRHFEELLSSWSPQVVHFHHTLHLGVELLALVHRVLPEAVIVYTLHEYIAICNANGHMLRTMDRALCETASPARCHECFPDRHPAELKRRELFLKTHLAHVDRFIAPSEFLRQRYLDWGLSADSVLTLDYGRKLPAPAPPRETDGPRNVFGFFGSLHPDKGLKTLLEAVSDDIELRIHGANLEDQTAQFRGWFEDNVDRLSNVAFAGPYEQADIPQLMEALDWVVVPSVWWENSPLVIQEAFMHRRPVIASNVGGMAEKVRDRVDGLHFRVGDPQDLTRAMAEARNPELWESLRAGVRDIYSIEDCARDHAALYDRLRAEK